MPGDGAAFCIQRLNHSNAAEPPPSALVGFNYLGQFAAADADGIFTHAPQSTGESQCLDGTRAHSLDINALASGDQLSVTISYSDQQFNAQTVERLAALIESSLTELINLCSDPSTCGYTPSDFPLAELDQTQLDSFAAHHGRGIEALYPLSPMQAGMAFHTLLDESGDAAYFEQLTCRVDGNFDTERFKQAWQTALARHSVLRSGLWTAAQPPLQFVPRHVALPWPVSYTHLTLPTKA